MEFVFTILLGGIFGIILMGLCVSSSRWSRWDEKREEENNRNVYEQKECHCDKE